MPNHKIKLAILLLISLAATPALSAVMSSTNYAIERDSINFSGGLSTSTSYSSESTLTGIETGLATSTSYILNGGYQQMDGSTLSLTVPGAQTMSGTITTANGGIATASATLNVATNGSGGYTLQIKASTSPALVSGANYFSDYSTSSPLDYAWSVDTGSAKFGFTPEGSDIVTRFKDSGGACNVAGSDTAEACWSGFYTAYDTIAQSAASNYPAGTNTTVRFKAEAGATASQAAGTYTATVIITAFAN